MAAALILLIIPVLVFILAMTASALAHLSTLAALAVIGPVAAVTWVFIALLRIERREDNVVDDDQLRRERSPPVARLSLDVVDAATDGSFPASDPPGWPLGRDALDPEALLASHRSQPPVDHFALRPVATEHEPQQRPQQRAANGRAQGDERDRGA